MKAVPAVLGIVLLGPLAFAGFPLPIGDPGLDAALGWLRDRLGPDGCIAPEPGGDCSHASTRDSVIAASAAGTDPATWGSPGATPLSFLADHREDLETEPGACAACRWAKTVVAVAAAGRDPHAFGGYDYVARLDGFYDGVQVGSPNQVNDDAWAIFAWAASDEAASEKVERVRLYLAARQNRVDGGWSWNLAPKSEAWGTATVALALLSTGTAPDDPTITDAVEFLRGQQSESGLVLQDGFDSAESTALVIQVLAATDQDPSAWTRPGGDLLTALLALQSADGSFRHNRDGGSEFLATTQVLPALRGVPYPFRPPSVAITQSPSHPTIGETVELRAVASDPDGEIRSHAWTIDGSPAGETATLALSFDVAGLHDVTLLVEDDDGVSRTVSSRIEVRTGSTPEATGTPSTTMLEATVDTSAPPIALEEAPEVPSPGIGWVLAALVGSAFVRSRRRPPGRSNT